MIKSKSNFNVSADIRGKCVCLHCGKIFDTPTYHFEGEVLDTGFVVDHRFQYGLDRIKHGITTQIAHVNKYDIMMQNRTMLNPDCMDCHNGPTIYVNDNLAHIFSALIHCGLYPEYWEYKDGDVSEGRISLASVPYPRAIVEFIMKHFTAEKSVFDIVIHLDEKFTEQAVKEFEDDLNRILSSEDTNLTHDEIKVKTYANAFRGIAWADRVEDAIRHTEYTLKYYQGVKDRYTEAIKESASAFDEEINVAPAPNDNIKEESEENG